MAAFTAADVKALREKTGVTVTLQDERLSSREAKASFDDAKATGQAKTEHELAACLILRSWLEA